MPESPEEVCLANILQHKSLVHYYPELLSLSGWLLVPLWLCRINDTAACDELNWSKWYCRQNQATAAPSPKWFLSGKEKIVTRTSMQGNTEVLTISCKLAAESLETCYKCRVRFICSTLVVLVQQAGVVVRCSK